MKFIFTALLIAFGVFFNSIELTSQFDNGRTPFYRPFIPPGPPAHPRPVITVRLVPFPRNDAYKIRVERGRYVPLPAAPIPALTSENGYAGAVVYEGVVRGIFDKYYRRGKLDMISNQYKQMGNVEIIDFPVDYEFRHSNWTVCLVPHTHCDPWQSH